MNMADNFKKIEDELKKVTDEYQPDIELIFNIGVKLGRQLQEQNITDIRLPFFVEKEELANLVDSVRKTQREIADLILNQVHDAINETIEEDGSWTVGVGSYYRGDGALSEEIVKKYYVQFQSIKQPQTDGDFETSFSVQGKLAEVFNEFEYSPTIQITLDNESGEDNATLDSKHDVKNLYSPTLMIYVKPNKEELDKLKKFKEALVKKLMFQIIGRT
jgi:hypothetical protein